MSGASSLFRDEMGRRPMPAPGFGGDATAVTAWLRRSLAGQYDAVLTEDLPPALVALARGRPGEH